MVSCSEALKSVREMLSDAGIENSVSESQWLFEHFFGVPYRNMSADERDKDAAKEKYEAFINAADRRIKGEPLQYILGEWEFYGYPFEVGKGVLIPRQDTETLIEVVKRINIPSPSIADLCSGSGCIAVTLSKEIRGASVTAVEKYEEAAFYLRRNIKINDAEVTVVMGDVLEHETVDGAGCFDIIVSNPPYLTESDMNELQEEVRHEPATALFGGEDGLGFYRSITALWKEKIRKGGYLVYEIGMGQENDVAKILRENGFEDIAFTDDLCNIIRVVSARKN